LHIAITYVPLYGESVNPCLLEISLTPEDADTHLMFPRRKPYAQILWDDNDHVIRKHCLGSYVSSVQKNLCRPTNDKRVCSEKGDRDHYIFWLQNL
jgi:hypothetical protein